MIQYTPEIILRMVQQLYSELNDMTATVEKLETSLNTYKKTVEDGISRKTEEVIKKMKLLIAEIHDLINEKTSFVEDGTRIIVQTEQSASEEIY